MSVIPNITERYISLEINKLPFLDSYQFLSSSLDTLVGNLPKGQFYYTERHMSENESVFRKGVFPYEYMTGEDVMNERCLPPKEAFYTRLTESDIDDDYTHAQQYSFDVTSSCNTLKER